MVQKDSEELIKGNKEGHELIFKKIKDEENKEHANLLQEIAINKANAMEMETENNKINKRLEKDLEQIIDKLSKKLQANEELQENDADLNNLIEIIEEFEGLNFSGLELKSSNLGKIFKTLHHLLVKKKTLLNKTVRRFL